MSTPTTTTTVRFAMKRDESQAGADAAVATTRAIMRGDATAEARKARNILALTEAGLIGEVVSPLTEDETTLLAKALTPQRMEVLGDLMEGYSYTEMAGRQGRKVDTVKAHCANLYRLFGVSSRVECVMQAVALGVLPAPPAPEAPAPARKARKAPAKRASR